MSRRAPIAILAVLSLLLIWVGPTTAAPAPGSAFVRVNQVGYPSAASKRAYLLSSVDQSGASFTVTSSTGTTVLSAPIGARLGSWSSGFSNVYALDFDAV